MQGTQSTSNKVTYRRVPIDPEREIRLLTLYAGSPQDEIQCSLRASQRDQTLTKYEALSYTWGSSRYNRTILVNETYLAVTDNLFAAIWRLRRPDWPRTLWVDAICIDQTNAVERSIQVQHIRDIYRRSQGVLVWLGNSNEMESIALDRFQTDCASLSADWQRKSLLQAIGETEPRWWERVWVWQEFASATDPPSICFGRVQVSYADFNTLARSIRNDKPGPSELSPHAFLKKARRGSLEPPPDPLDLLTDCVNYLDSLRADVGGFINRPLSEMIRKTVRAKATDPRDKIFSLLGFLRPQDANLLKPNYNKRFEEICAAATYTYVLETDLTTALSWVQLNPTRASTSNMPSWVIDFEHPPEIGDKDAWFARFDCNPPNISNNVKRFKLDNSALSVVFRGHKFAFIEDVISYPVPGLSRMCDEVWLGLETEFDLVNADDGWENVRGKATSNNELLPLVALLLHRPRVEPYRARPMKQTHDVDHRIRAFELAANEFHSLSTYPRDETDEYRRHIELRESDEQHWEDEVKSWDNEPLRDSNLEGKWNRFHRRSDISKLFTLWSRSVGFSDLDHATNYRTFHEAWQHYAQATARQPVLFTTKSGFLGIGPNSILRGDIVALIPGVHVPVILRKIADYYTFQGLAHVHGIMYNELAHICPDFKFKTAKFEVR